MGPRLRTRRLAEDQSDAGKSRQPQGGRCARQESRRAVLPGAVLVRADADAAEERLPRHRRERQRDLAEHPQPGRVDSQHRQHRRLHRLPSDGRPGDADDSDEHPRAVPGFEDGVGSPHPGRTGRRRHERPLHAGRPPARARDVRGLDRSHRQRRTAGGSAAASAGPRAQRRHHDVGLGGSEGLPARRDRERQAQSHGQRRTVRFTARSKRAATTSRSSIRRRTRRARSS